jgi:acetylornithine deacetylase/succinyl-diaminopimelate desuccinylase-like protein
MDLLSLSRDLIAADTVSNKGTSAAVSILKPLYEAAGLRTVVQEEYKEGVSQQNLLGTLAGSDDGGLLLVTHLDTVDPGPPEMWTETTPHVLAKKGDKVYGLGSADTKLDSICKLFAAREVAKGHGGKLKRSLQLLGTYEEEVGCKGARHFSRSPLFKSRWVSCSEPSELVIIRAHKGYAVVKVELYMKENPELDGPFERVIVDGKAAHSSTPHLGVNAIEKSLETLGTGPLVSLEGGSVANKVPARSILVRPGKGGEVAVPADRRDCRQAAVLARSLFAAWKRLALAQRPEVNASFNPDRCVVNWGVARIGGARAELTFDCRLLPGHDPEALTTAFALEASKLGEAGGATRVEVEVDRSSPAMELKEPSTLLDAARAACRDVGLNDKPEAKPTNTEAGVFASMGVEAIVFGPGRSTGNAHCANEHNLYPQMEKAIEFYRALITRLCL